MFQVGTWNWNEKATRACVYLCMPLLTTQNRNICVNIYENRWLNRLQTEIRADHWRQFSEIKVNRTWVLTVNKRNNSRICFFFLKILLNDATDIVMWTERCKRRRANKWNDILFLYWCSSTVNQPNTLVNFDEKYFYKKNYGNK